MSKKKQIPPDKFISKIKKDIKYNNRFFVDEEFNKYLDDISGDEDLIKEIKTKSILYRARIYNKEDVYDKYNGEYKYSKNEKFYGFSAEESFICKDNSKINDGRCNPKFIPYLYMAEDIDTAVKEVRPCTNTPISVSEIRVLRDLKILDLSREDSYADDLWMLDFKTYINSEMSKPYYKNGDYLLTQYISEYIKRKDFDGIAYCSVFVTNNTHFTEKVGTNILVFNYEKCKAINSKLYLVGDITIKKEPFKIAEDKKRK